MREVRGRASGCQSGKREERKAVEHLGDGEEHQGTREAKGVSEGNVGDKRERIVNGGLKAHFKRRNKEWGGGSDKNTRWRR